MKDALLAKLIKRYGETVNSYMLPDDKEEFIELFPALASKVIYEALEDRLSRIPAGNNDPFINYVYRKIEFLKNENPYNRSLLPWLSDKKHLELYQLKKAELDKRRLIEETYILGPEQAGMLFDEDVYRLRSRESLDWVLGRLKNLGFGHHIEDNKNTFIMEYSGYLIYADPRKAGSIEVFVYKKESGEKTARRKKASNIYKYPIGHFKIQDSWKKDLRTKLISRIEGVIHRSGRR